MHHVKPCLLFFAIEGHLKENDEIWAVNGKRLDGFTHQQAVQVLRTAGNVVKLQVLRHKNLTCEMNVLGWL